MLISGKRSSWQISSGNVTHSMVLLWGGGRERRRYTMLIFMLKGSENLLPKIWVNIFWRRLSQTPLTFYQHLTSHRKNALWNTLGNTGLDKFSHFFLLLFSTGLKNSLEEFHSGIYFVSANIWEQGPPQVWRGHRIKQENGQKPWSELHETHTFHKNTMLLYFIGFLLASSKIQKGKTVNRYSRFSVDDGRVLIP